MRARQRIARVVMIERQYFAPARGGVARLALRTQPAAMHILPGVARGARLRGFAKQRHAAMAGNALRAAVPAGQAIRALAVMMECLCIKLRQWMRGALVFDMAGAAGLGARLGHQAMKPGLRGTIARDPGVARQALRGLRLALKRQVACAAAPLEPGMRGRQWPGADQPLDRGFGAQRADPAQQDHGHDQQQARQPAHQ